MAEFYHASVGMTLEKACYSVWEDVAVPAPMILRFGGQ